MPARDVATVAVLMTCHNRSAATLAALASLRSQAGARGQLEVDVFLVDAGSTDSTVAAVRQRHPDIHIVESDDRTYWGQGMALAAGVAGDGHDYHLWLNDDVVLAPDALRRLHAVAADGDRVVVGATCDAGGRRTYGGFRRGRRTLEFLPVDVSDRPEPCDTINGNVVLVPRNVIAAVGSIDPGFPHAMGDIDFGLRVRAAGFEISQTAGFIGRCEGHEPEPSPSGPLIRLREITSVKRLPPGAWWRFCYRHAGLTAPPYFIKPYLSAVIGHS